MKRWIARLCASVLVISLLILPALASGHPFFLALNDTLLPQADQSTPVQSDGWIYVPVDVLNHQLTGVNFNIYYGLTDHRDSLVLYNLSGKTMTFHLSGGTATAANGTPPIPGRALWKNGLYYVPAYSVCRYFGLSYSYYVTEYGPVLRMKNGNAVLNDRTFISSAAPMMAERRKNTLAEEISVSPPLPVVPSPPKESGEKQQKAATSSSVSSSARSQNPIAVPAPVVSLCLGICVVEDQEITGILNALSRVNAEAVVFFPADVVKKSAGQIRQAVGRGYKVGLIPTGETSEAQKESIARGSQAMNQILLQETWFVLGVDSVLQEEGYLGWEPDVSPSSSETANSIYQSVLSIDTAHHTPIRVLLSGDMDLSVLGVVLDRWARDGDTFLATRETEYGSDV